ncbi:hypothetical protein Pmani_012195 [Petrolisthes manimaculis]|uniref:RNA-directed DNA polymerase n=1 Tax=Petrolisthes manimaculis TaxID=1843537 RepID=A0AAE1UFB5_9EUCA|nr:hypothetical protein Pmani_012195 [Petrolisthes manimaculis]
MINSVTWYDVHLTTSSDPSMIQLLHFITDGFPDCHLDLLPDLRPYHPFHDSLTSVDGIVLYNDRVIIPQSLHHRVLQTLHSAHQGVSQMCSHVESSFFWPDMTPAIIEKWEHCSSCNRMTPSQPSVPPTPPVQPAYSFQSLVSHYFHHCSRNYLVAVDRYSNHCTSSVAFTHSNCGAEVGVKIVKLLITDNTDTDTEDRLDNNKFQRAMFQYCNTPDPDTHLSPAMCN